MGEEVAEAGGGRRAQARAVCEGVARWEGGDEGCLRGEDSRGCAGCEKGKRRVWWWGGIYGDHRGEG